MDRALSERAALAGEWCLFNAPYLLTLGVACALLDDGRPYVAACSVFFVSLTGYALHRIAHTIKYAKTFEVLSTCPAIGGAIGGLLSHMDFHRAVHHDERESRKLSNTLIEMYQNLLSQGLGQIALNVWWWGGALNNWIMAMWAALYTSAHLINFRVHPARVHELHHQHPSTNFEPYLYDLLFDTYSGPETISTNDHYNYGVANILVITAALLAFKKN